MKHNKNVNKVSSPRNVVGDLRLTCRYFTQRLFPCLIKTKSAEDSRQKPSGMTLYDKQQAFTLIELLVVVLIIGILSAIALPQYEKAVWKSRNAELKTLVKSIYQAQLVYFMANGTYAGNFNELDVDLPLEAPAQSGTHESICYYGIQGTDSVRQGKDFRVIINATNLAAHGTIFAYYTSGKYKCNGFRIPSTRHPGQLACAEINPAPGDFCEKLENGFDKVDGNGVQTWQLP